MRVESSEWYGLWPLAVIMVVIASWLLYRYVAPKGWRESSRAGLVQRSPLRFGETYQAYRRRVPMLLPPQPQWRPLIEPRDPAAEHRP